MGRNPFPVSAQKPTIAWHSKNQQPWHQSEGQCCRYPSQMTSQAADNWGNWELEVERKGWMLTGLWNTPLRTIRNHLLSFILFLAINLIWPHATASCYYNALKNVLLCLIVTNVPRNVCLLYIYVCIIISLRNDSAIHSTFVPAKNF